MRILRSEGLACEGIECGAQGHAAAVRSFGMLRSRIGDALGVTDQAESTRVGAVHGWDGGMPVGLTALHRSKELLHDGCSNREQLVHRQAATKSFGGSQWQHS